MLTLLAIVDLWLAAYCGEIVPWGQYNPATVTCEAYVEMP